MASGSSSSLPQSVLPPAGNTSARTRRQQGLFFGGVAFVVFSAIVTRRSLAKRYKPIAVSSSTTPLTKGLPTSGQGAGYTPASAHPSQSSTTSASKATSEAGTQEGTADLNNSGPLLAVEALTVATLNVFSWAIMVTGGALWAFDIASMDDMRRKIRGGLGVDGTGRTEQEAEEEMEEWLATVLDRKEKKRRTGDDQAFRDEKGRQR